MGSNPTGPATTPPVPQIAEYLWEIQKQGYKPQTTQSHSQTLRLLSKLCRLEDPETIRTYLAHSQISMGRKQNHCKRLQQVYQVHRHSFDEPRYRREDSLPRIPLEQWLLDVINTARHAKHATTLRGLYETACRVRMTLTLIQGLRHPSKSSQSKTGEQQQG